MKRKVQRRVRPITSRYAVEPSEQKKSLLDLLRDWFGIIAAAAGGFTVLLYLTGRYYAVGYFSAMNIPDYMVSLSIWEYGESGWLVLFGIPAIVLFVSTMLAGILVFLYKQLSSRSK